MPRTVADNRLVVAVTVAVSAWLLADPASVPANAQSAAVVIWHDDFESGTPLSQRYFEYDDAAGRFAPVPGVGLNGSVGMRAAYEAGNADAGYLHQTFGRSPLSSRAFPGNDFREVYWRLYVRNETGWRGNPYKLSRVTSIGSSAWAQAMIAHNWGDGTGEALTIDPATGINANGQLATTGYNDFTHLRWLGLLRGITPVFATSGAGHWYCVEAHVKLNSPGSSDGVFEFWVDGNLEARNGNLNWVGTWTAYGINMVMVENYWNGGPTTGQTRYVDELVVSTGRIGCGLTIPPQAPQNVRIR
jgi:hypothetical protein